MAVIPNSQALGTVPVSLDRNPPRIDAGDFAAPARALQGVAAAANNLGQALLASDRQEEDYDAQKKLITFDLEQEKALQAAKRDTAPDAKDFTRNYRASYDQAARDLMTQIPESLKPEFDRRLVQRGAHYEQQAFHWELQQRDLFHKDDVKNNLIQLQNAITADPATYRENIRRGQALIKASKLDAWTKQKLAESYARDAEESAVRARIASADHGTLQEVLTDLKRIPETSPYAAPGVAVPEFSGKPSQGYWGGDPAFRKLSPVQRAAAVAILEAGFKNGRIDMDAARNVLGTMINRASKDGKDLGESVSSKIYQPVTEPAQYARLKDITESPEFGELADLAGRRLSGEMPDWVNGATHFLAPEPVMERLTKEDAGASPTGKPQKYVEWPNWSGYAKNGGLYGNVMLRDRSHAYLAPEGRHSARFDPQKPPVQDANTSGEDGNIPYRFLTPGQRISLTNIARVADRTHATRAVDDDLERIRRTGQSLIGADGKTSLDRARASLTENEFARAQAEWRKAHLEYDAISPLQGMTPEAAAAHLDELVPGEELAGDSYRDSWAVHDKAVKAWKAIETQRERDPGLSVNSDPLVKLAYRDAKATKQVPQPDGTVATLPALSPQEQNQKIIDARLAAQARLGIPLDQRSPITRGEAERLLGIHDPSKLDEQTFFDRIAAAAKRAEESYGPEYGVYAMQKAIGFMVRSKEQRLVTAGIILKMAKGEGLSAADMRKLNLTQGMAPLSRFVDQFDEEATNRATLSHAPAAPQAALPSTFGVAVSAPNGGVQPNKRQIEWLRGNPEGWREFDAKFGPGAAARVLRAPLGNSQ